MTRKSSTPRILGMRSSNWGDTNHDAIKRPNQPRNKNTMCVFAKPTGKWGLVKANPAR